MIALLQGKVVHLSAPMAVIATTSGVGYEVELSVPTFCQLQLDSEVQLWTHHHIREDASLLYGFIDYRDREIFRQLIKINGVGAKMALAMMSNMSVFELKQCVIDNDEMALTRVPGVGKKTAQRLLIELKDKLDHIELITNEQQLTDNNDNIQPTQNLIIAETQSALIGLGYKEKEAVSAINTIIKQTDSQFSNTQELLKATLQQLSK